MTNSQLIADLVDCLEYKEDMAHVQVIEGKGAVFWETMYALKRAAHEPTACQCGHPMACHDELSCQHYGCDCKGAAVKSTGDHDGS